MKFANIKTVAEYNIISQTLNFNDLTINHKENLLKNIDNTNFGMEVLKPGKLIAHEACHFIDHISTLSGMYMLEKIYSAINEFEHFNDELNSGKEKPSINNMIALLEVHQEWKQAENFKVYSPIVNTRWTYKDWAFNFRTSKTSNNFGGENKPTLLVDFKLYGKLYTQVPFTVESLWETNAMFAELDYHFLTLIQIENKDQKIVEAMNYDKEYNSYLYNPELFLYSVAAHMVSSFVDLKNVNDAFKLSKIISEISLNLPYKYYKTIKRTNGKIYRGIVNQFLKDSKEINPPVIFMTLLENIAECKDFEIAKFMEASVINIDRILAINNLPSKEILKNEILKEMESIELKVDNIQSHIFYHFKKIGIEYMKKFHFKGHYDGLSIQYIKYVCAVDNLIFQGWDEEALFAEETISFQRQELFNKYFKLMTT